MDEIIKLSDVAPGDKIILNNKAFLVTNITNNLLKYTVIGLIEYSTYNLKYISADFEISKKFVISQDK